jgi:hypothetical protein
LIVAPFCYAIENHGCWIQGSHGVLSFRSDLRAGTAIIFYISLHGMPLAGPQHWVTVNAAGPREVKKPISAKTRFVLRCSGSVGDKGNVTIDLTVEGGMPAQPDDRDARRFVVGIVGFGYATADDPIARADISEALLFDL